MSTRQFLVYVGGLTAEARWPQGYTATPHRADTPETIASVFGSYLGGDATEA